MELKSPPRLIADGFERWADSQREKTRATVRAQYASERASKGLFGQIRLWFKVEWACWRRPIADGKASRKILW
jgi:hypothetical protein